MHALRTETVIITGASRGIGLALTQRFLQAERRVLATSRTLQGAETLRELSGRSPLLQVFTVDVSDGASVGRFVSEVSNEAIDVLVNNAGVNGGSRQDLDDMDYEGWLRTLAVNTLAPFRLAAALLPNLKRAPRPRVVTLSSQMGSLSRKSRGHYAYRSSKAAVNKVMQVLAVELEQDGVIVCPVHPGWVRTEMGGPNAEISAAESAEGLFVLVESLTMAHSGRFWTWDGQEHPW